MLLKINMTLAGTSLGGGLAHSTLNKQVLVGCDTARTYLLFPVQLLFCRSVWCGRLQNKVQDRGWALLNIFYSNTKSDALVSHSSPSSLCLDYSLFPGLVQLSLPHPRFCKPPPSLVSFAPAPLPPPFSSCDGNTPYSRSRSPASRENGVQLGARVVLAMWLGLWMLLQTSGWDSRSYLAELVHLLKELVVKNE